MSEPDNALLTEIGRFTVDFSQLEFSIKHFLAQAIRLPDEHFNSVMSYDFASLCSIAKDVYRRTMPPDRAEEVKAILNACLKLNEDRVRIMHGLWFIDDGSSGVHHVSRTTRKPSLSFESPLEVSAKAEEARELSRRFIEAVLKFP